MKINIGFIPVMADLYNRLCPDLREKLDKFSIQLSKELSDLNINFKVAPVSSKCSEIKQQLKLAEDNGSQLIVVGLVSYAPSGQVIPALSESQLPILLWPAQSMLELKPAQYDIDCVLLNHGVHGLQEAANVLIKGERPFGIIHGHHHQPEFKRELLDWAKAACVLYAMKTSNPVILGGHFEDMLDLQIGDAKFISQLGIKKRSISIAEFTNDAASISERKITDRARHIRSSYEIDKSLNDELLNKAVRNELALRELLKKNNSQAAGINFMTLCNDQGIADALHLAACTLMEDGFGYAGEGDWVTAAFLRGILSADLEASFSEIFSVGYLDNRLVLRHWGEGNPLLARSKPILRASSFQDKHKAEFVVMDFEFSPGPATLINLNADSYGHGRLICFEGVIEDGHLPAVDGPRAIFKPQNPDVRELLTSYAYNGGSHHLVLVRGDCRNVVDSISKLTGWNMVSI